MYLKTILERWSFYSHNYWFFIRSRTLVYTFTFATCIGVLISFQGATPIPLLLTTTLGMYLASLGVYVYNDLTDIGEDTINSAHRPLIAGKVTRSHATNLIILSWISSLLLQASITWQVFAMTLLYILLGIAYSHPLTHLKKLFPFKTIVTALGGAMASLIGGLAAGNVTPQVLFAATAFFLFFFILGPLGDVDDVEGDRIQGRRTFAVVMGVENTIKMILFVPLIIALLAIFMYHFVGFNITLPFLIGSVSGVSFFILKPLTAQWKDREYLKKTRNRIRPMHIVLQVAILLSSI